MSTSDHITLPCQRWQTHHGKASENLGKPRKASRAQFRARFRVRLRVRLRNSGGSALDSASKSRPALSTHSSGAFEQRYPQAIPDDIEKTTRVARGVRSLSVPLRHSLQSFALCKPDPKSERLVRLDQLYTYASAPIAEETTALEKKCGLQVNAIVSDLSNALLVLVNWSWLIYTAAHLQVDFVAFRALTEHQPRQLHPASLRRAPDDALASVPGTQATIVIVVQCTRHRDHERLLVSTQASVLSSLTHRRDESPATIDSQPSFDTLKAGAGGSQPKRQGNRRRRSILSNGSYRPTTLPPSSGSGTFEICEAVSSAQAFDHRPKCIETARKSLKAGQPTTRLRSVEAEARIRNPSFSVPPDLCSVQSRPDEATMPIDPSSDGHGSRASREMPQNTAQHTPLHTCHAATKRKRQEQLLQYDSISPQSHGCAARSEQRYVFVPFSCMWQSRFVYAVPSLYTVYQANAEAKQSKGMSCMPQAMFKRQGYLILATQHFLSNCSYKHNKEPLLLHETNRQTHATGDEHAKDGWL
ncbi:hypothetical protein AALT_g11706 [Alternaria alternata]|nr:hypothetical protein AALT_g11706 [Alternaria alternata]